MEGIAVDVLAEILLLVGDVESKEDVLALVRGCYDAAVKTRGEKEKGK
jgi:hypothetical protein